jgi:hypothetical protein
VYFLNGEYTGIQVNESISYRWCAWTPQNSGTVSAPVRFKSLNRHGAKIVGLRDAVAIPVIGSYLKDYVVWDGFVLEAVNSTGDPILATAQIFESDGCSILNCVIRGAAHNTGGAENYQGVWIQDADDFTLENSRIYNFRETSEDNHNTSGFKSYRFDNLTIKNCEFTNSTVGIYLKGSPMSNATVSNTFLYGNSNAIRAEASDGITFGNNTNFTFDNCVIADSNTTAIYLPTDETANNNFVFSNLTIHGVGLGYAISWKAVGDGFGPKIYNTIISNAHASFASIKDTNVVSTHGDISVAPIECDHNRLDFTNPITMRLYNAAATQYSTLSAWKSSGELYGGGNPGVGSITGDPLFVNTSGTLSEVADFALASGSPCIGAGRDAVNMGADVTLVGVLAESAPVDPTTTTTGPILRTGTHLLRVGDSVLRVQ